MIKIHKKYGIMLIICKYFLHLPQTHPRNCTRKRSSLEKNPYLGDFRISRMKMIILLITLNY